MKFIKQFDIILAISFIGEIMNYLIPLPVPASIYGLVLMLLCLHFGIVHIDSVKDSGKFLIEIMPLMFIPAAVGLIESWKTIGSKIGTYLIITVLSTIFVMIVAGHTTQAFIRFSKSKDNQERKDS
ncbi:CidA/LrgA family protein [Dorea sp. AM13-35]|uniref:CidA/LrgA family protein n=1 Tax=Dorea sp. AM13-35 TaxID=2293099 RepID=UPI000E4C134B|nr:CidA/LrgA family protein [Dorea sp. AM13-35]RHO38956.1 CidA/LrgA family protein [Dorea sp. AM13-35]